MIYDYQSAQIIEAMDEHSSIRVAQYRAELIEKIEKLLEGSPESKFEEGHDFGVKRVINLIQNS